MAFPRWILGILVTATLASCADKKKTELAESLVREIPATDKISAALMVEEAKLKCQGDCPENVGLYLATRPNSVLTCTAFLIEKDIVATNSHCLPRVVKDLPDLCPSTVQFLFPKSKSHPEERIACKELLGYSERPNAVSPDLALLRLEKPLTRNPLIVSKAGIQAEKTHTAWKVNPGPGASGELVRQECKMVEKNYRLPLYNGKLSSVFVAGDCPSLPGNSGAPLISPEGTAVGIFQADLPFNEMQIKAWSKHLLPGETFSPLAMGTSLICLENSSPFRWNPFCEVIDEESIVRPRISDFNFEEEIPEESFEKTFFHWRSIQKTKTLEREERFEPKCYRAILEKEKEFVTPVFQAKIFFNRYMQVFPKFQKIGEEKTVYSMMQTESGWQLVSPQKDIQTISPCEIDSIKSEPQGPNDLFNSL